MDNKRLCNQIGYYVKLVSSAVFNPGLLGESEDNRDLSVFVTYIGAYEPEKAADFVYKEDPYVVTRVDPANGSIWNPYAYRDFYGFEGNGTWARAIAGVNVKDEGIQASGLRICFDVPRQLVKSVVTLDIYVNDILLKQIMLTEPGQKEVLLDVNSVYEKEEEYLENAQRILKILLADFDRVCRKYDLKYYLICGSLLGAVRHKDLIAWDDDVDVAMPRKDFDKLLKYVKVEWGKDADIQFVNYNQMGNHTFLDYMTRIVYMKEEIPVNVFKKIKGKGRTDLENHMPMDIYVLDNAADNKKVHEMHTKIIQGIYGLAMGHRAFINKEEYNNRDDKMQKLVRTLSTIGSFIPLSAIFKLYEIVRKWYKNKPGEYYFESNGFIFCIPWRFKKEWFGEGSRLPVGDLLINAPSNYHEFLKMHYSEHYMTFPSLEVRKPTHSEEAAGIF